MNNSNKISKIIILMIVAIVGAAAGYFIGADRATNQAASLYALNTLTKPNTVTTSSVNSSELSVWKDFGKGGACYHVTVAGNATSYIKLSLSEKNCGAFPTADSSNGKPPAGLAGAYDWNSAGCTFTYAGDSSTGSSYFTIKLPGRTRENCKAFPLARPNMETIMEANIESGLMKTLPPISGNPGSIFSWGSPFSGNGCFEVSSHTNNSGGTTTVYTGPLPGVSDKNSCLATRVQNSTSSIK